MGVTTIDTGTVLRKFVLSDGSAMLLAVEEWLTPSGQAIWHKGITPDNMVALPADVSSVFPAEERNMTVAQLQIGRDKQLLRAIAPLSPRFLDDCKDRSVYQFDRIESEEGAELSAKLVIASIF
jgi:carboxyl-terminal processing protease